MKRYVPIFAILALVLPGSAVANTPQDPCAHNPTTLCGPGFTVVPEPAGENCPNGGIKIVIVRGKPDEEPAPLTSNPKPDPADEVFFICNGVDGGSGTPGAPGPEGPQGLPGSPGAPGQLPAGCVNTRNVSPLILPKRGARQRKFPRTGRVRVRINGTTQVRRIRTGPNGRRFVLVTLRGLDCGVYPITVGRRGVLPAKRIWILRGGNRVEKFTVGNKGTGPVR